MLHVSEKSIKEELRESGLRFTKQRADVLSILKMSSLPLSMDELITRLSIEMDLSTVYRILDAFEEKGLINKTILIEPNQNILYTYNRKQHEHHLICTSCLEMKLIHGCPLDQYEAEVEEETGYVVGHHQLELYGLCPKCQAKEEAKK